MTESSHSDLVKPGVGALSALSRVEKEAPLTALQSATSLASYTRRCISQDRGAFPGAVVEL